MSSTLEKKNTLPTDTGRDPGEKHYRILVKSPEEALKVIRKKFGDKAKVLSVKQVEGEGLAKFLSSPKLEIILTVANGDPTIQETLKTASREGVSVEEHQQPDSQVAASSSETAEKNKAISRPHLDVTIGNGFGDSISSLSPAVGDSSVYGLLKRAGFDEGLLAALQDSPEMEGLDALPTSHALAEVSHWLKKRFDGIKPRPTSSRTAFLGTPGTGKTTALCKILAHSAFFENHTTHVFKLDQAIPNPDDALRIFCESLGIHLYRDRAVLPTFPSGELLYVDTPGIPLNDNKGWSDLGRELDELGVATRVLVLNATYDAQILKSTLDAAVSCRPTHLIFTHLDELQNSAKLWPFVFSKEVSTLMFCHGQNITSDYTRDNLCNYLLASSFPRRVLIPS
jgi:flagellar biosynthesis protein FlhF